MAYKDPPNQMDKMESLDYSKMRNSIMQAPKNSIF